MSRVGVRKELANVPQCGSSQQRVRDSVQQGIRVAVPGQVIREGNITSPEPQRPTLHEPMRIITQSDTVAGRS